MVAGKCTAASAGGSSLAAVAVAAGGEDTGEELGEECAGAGQRGADDGDITFDGGPSSGGDVVVCSIVWLDTSSLGWGVGLVSSQVGSVELETSRRLRKRRMVVSMTLSLVSLMCTFILA